MGRVAYRTAGKLGRWGVGGDDRLEAYPTLRLADSVVFWGGDIGEEGDERAFVAYGAAGKLGRWGAGGDDRLEAYPTGFRSEFWRIRLRVGLADAAGWQGRFVPC